MQKEKACIKLNIKTIPNLNERDFYKMCHVVYINVKGRLVFSQKFNFGSGIITIKQVRF